MPRTLRILLVEDSADDADLLRFGLEEAGLPFELRRVHCEGALREAMEAFEPDVAVSDLHLPGYCGVAALTLLHELRPALPLVLLSGDAERAPDGLPARVLDKARLDRLPALLADIAG
ncbi:MAG TPA: response regulator [Thermomonas sp.]|jgi:CheY-like chemotaxis protein|nr:response regulator [Thermomonas sp.]